MPCNTAVVWNACSNLPCEPRFPFATPYVFTSSSLILYCILSDTVMSRRRSSVCAAQAQPPQTFAYAGLFGANAGPQPDPSTQQPQQQGFVPAGFGQGYGPHASAAQPARYGIVPPPTAAPATTGALTLPPPGMPLGASPKPRPEPFPNAYADVNPNLTNLNHDLTLTLA